MSSNIVLSVEDLRVTFRTVHGLTHAVRGVSFELRRGQTLALVGESGSGKSVSAYSILRLIQRPGEITGGKIVFSPAKGSPVDIAGLSSDSEELYRIRGGKISMIFQEPMTALSPVHTVGNQICEAILLHQKVTPKQAEAQAIEMLEKVGIPDPSRRLTQYPFEFSGGMRQRVVIAMALVCRPEILIADEPTTALDVTVQALILQLIKDLQRDMGTSVLFITHDLGVVAQMADDLVVMQEGRLVESAPLRPLYADPYHPYTQQLLASIPTAEEMKRPAARTPFVPPEGLSIDPPANPAGVTPVQYQLPGSRRILLWPKAAAVKEFV